MSALQESVRGNRNEMVNFLLSCPGIDLTQNSNRWPRFVWESDSEEIVQSLIGAGFKIEHAYFGGRHTLLEIMLVNRNYSIAKSLIRNGAKIDNKYGVDGVDGLSLMMLFLRSYWEDPVIVFDTELANLLSTVVDETDDNNNTAFMYCPNDYTAIRFLNEHCNSDVNAINTVGNTAILLAMDECKLELAYQLLLRENIDITIVNPEGKNAFEIFNEKCLHSSNQYDVEYTIPAISILFERHMSSLNSPDDQVRREETFEDSLSNLTDADEQIENNEPVSSNIETNRDLGSENGIPSEFISRN